MQFDDNYFKGEYREGYISHNPEDYGTIYSSFYVEEKMKRAWAAQIEVLNTIDSICRKHNIRYFADWGTLLGAVRHHGFIPWDDDIDICMLREDFDKFIQCAPSELPNSYSLLSIHTENEWEQLHSRVVNCKEINFTDEHLSKFHGCPYVIGLDIFCLDFIPTNPGEFETFKSLFSSIIRLSELISTSSIPYSEKVSAIEQIETLCNVNIDKFGNVQHQLLKLLDSMSKIYTDDESEYVCLLGYCLAIKESCVLRKDWYKETIYLPFENFSIPVPADYQKVLTVLYGEEYMTPIRIYETHDYPFYKKQDAAIEAFLNQKADD